MALGESEEEEEGKGCSGRVELLKSEILNSERVKRLKPEREPLSLWRGRFQVSGGEGLGDMKDEMIDWLIG